MASVVGVLCARVRVEEKHLLLALAEAGVPARTLTPADAPLPICPVPPVPPTGRRRMADGGDVRVIIDRCQNRTVAAAELPLRVATGAIVLDAGLAARGTRATIATALAAAGIRRPATYLVTSEEAGLTALDALGYPATYLPLPPGSAEIALLDRDTAEAVFEHRGTLGGASAAIGILQAGTSVAEGRVSVIVIGGRAVAIHDPSGQARYAARYAGIAEAAARALDAEIIGVELVKTADGPVVWDVQPVPDFRDATRLGTDSVVAAIVDLVKSHTFAAETLATQLALDAIDVHVTLAREVTDGVVLSA